MNIDAFVNVYSTYRFMLIIYVSYIYILSYSFDEVRRGEPAKKMKGVKRSFRDNVSSSGLQNEKVYIMLYSYNTIY